MSWEKRQSAQKRKRDARRTISLARAVIAVVTILAMVGAADVGLCAPKSKKQLPFARPEAVPMPVSSDPHVPHWFILVNGQGIPQPMAQFTPSVLTVNGTGPAGSPNPNSGTGVGVAPINVIASPVSQASPSASPAPVSNGFTLTGAQLWRALPGTVAGDFYLRSAESFTTTEGSDNNPLGSLMLGYGAQEAVLDLGWLSGFDGAIYWDQSGSPTGDNSCFEQWSYSAKNKTAQLTNCNGGQLYNSTPTVKVGNGTSGPGNKWYPVPNYQLAGIIRQKNCDQNSNSVCDQNSSDVNATFPVWKNTQANAYTWISEHYSGSSTLETCQYTIGLGTAQQTLSFNGIRCEYGNSNFDPVEAQIQISNLTYPKQTKSGAFFTKNAFAVAEAQLNNELKYVQEVHELLLVNAFQVMNTVFFENSNTIPALVSDLGVSANAGTHAVAVDIVEGSLYTMLSALGPVTSVFANVMETAVDTAEDAHPTFSEDVGGTVGTLNENLNAQFNFMNDALVTDYNTIVYDWARLSTIGPKTLQQGYWGLAWPDTLTGIIVPYLVNGYQINVMKTLLPLVYNLHEVVGLTTNSLVGPPAWAEYAWDFGSGEKTSAPIGSSNTDWSSYYNLGYWETTETFGAASYPSSTVIENDLLDLGANPFEIFSGINGWGGVNGPVYYDRNINCDDGVVTLFNATPTELWVEWTTEQGVISGPGTTFNFNFVGDGFQGSAWTELRPYGYSTIFYAPGNDIRDGVPLINVNVWDYSFSSTQSVGSFDMSQDGCSVASITEGPFSTDDWRWAAQGTKSASKSEPGGLFLTLVNSSLPAK